MNRKATECISQAHLLVVVILLTGIATGCTHRLHTPMQPDGWSAQPVMNLCRFTPDADLDPATRTPVGDDGYSLYILTEALDWNFTDGSSLLFSIWQRPWGHVWIILESPGNRLEFGHTGDFGRDKPRYHEGVMHLAREGDPNPIAYLWQTMSDGQLQTGKPKRPPTFVWKMPITRTRHQMIDIYVKQRKYDQFGIRSDNCTDMVAEIATLAGIHLIHRMHLSLPSETKLSSRTMRVWTDPQYRILEFSTPEVLEVDLRQLAQIGIGSDATAWYLSLE